MHHLNVPELLLILAVMGLMFTGQRIHKTARALAEVIANFRGGGPGSPPHPLPANDSQILTRKRKRDSGS